MCSMADQRVWVWILPFLLVRCMSKVSTPERSALGVQSLFVPGRCIALRTVPGVEQENIFFVTAVKARPQSAVQSMDSSSCVALWGKIFVLQSSVSMRCRIPEPQCSGLNI